ncbi:MAG: glycosyltransferase family 39 protein [Candidatus Korobacteraceae bacterium]
MPAAREPSLARAPTTPARISREQAAVLVLLTIAGAWLRLSHLGSKSLWLDEGATVALARASWQHFAWVWWHAEASLQTIYFLLMRAWIRLGDSEAWLRLPSAVFGIASIPLLYLLARKFMGAVPALAAAALLAFSPSDVYYSQEARSYSLTILLVLLSMYYFVRAVEQNQSRDWLLWTLFGIVAFYSHDFAALVLVAQVVSLLFRATFIPWRRVITCSVAIFLFAIPGLTYVFRASPENLHFLWMPRASGKEFWHLAMFFGGAGVKVVPAGVLWIAGAVAVWRSRRGDADVFWRSMLIVVWAVLPAVILALISLRQPMFLQRYLIFSLPATILLAALGTQTLRKWGIGLLLTALLCGMSQTAITKEYRKPREDWRGACNAMLSSAAPGDAVAFVPFYSRVMLDYYRDRYGAGAPQLHIFAPGYYAGGEDVRDLLKTLDHDSPRFRHVWVLVDGDAYSDAVAEKLEATYGAPAVQKFAGIEVLEYGR